MKIQELRAKLAYEEIGVMNPEIIIDHEKPETIVNGRVWQLVFPKYLLKYQTRKKENVILFMGLITESRRQWLNQALASCPNVKIIPSNRGRRPELKAEDPKYFRKMGKAKFVLCPSGDFTWTYRFFEAVMLMAIPIVQEGHQSYRGFTYYQLGDEPIYSEEIVEKNFDEFRQRMML